MEFKSSRVQGRDRPRSKESETTIHYASPTFLSLILLTALPFVRSFLLLSATHLRNRHSPSPNELVPKRTSSSNPSENGFQKLEKIKDSNRKSRQLEDLTEKMRDSKWLIKEFDKEVKALESSFDRETNG